MRRAHASFAVLLLLPILLSCQPKIRLAGFGDSLTGGASWLDFMGYRYEVENYGIGGEESWDGVDRLLEALPELDADVVVLFWGTNDVLQLEWTVDQTVGPLGVAVDAVLAAGMTPVLVVPPPILRNVTIPKEQANERLLELQLALHSLAVVSGVEVAHLFVAFWLLPEIPDFPRTYFVDGVHFNATGRAVAASVIELTVQRALGGGG